MEDYARYIYLQRVKAPGVLIQAVREGLGLASWAQDSFAYAESYDEATNRYRGLRCGQSVGISEDSLFGLLVRPEPALKQEAAEKAAANGGKPEPTATSGGVTPGGEDEPVVVEPPKDTKPRRFHGTKELDPARVGRDASTVATEVIAHLAGLVGAKVKVTLEIEAEIPDGVPENVVRIVTENSRTLKFTNQGFEKE